MSENEQHALHDGKRRWLRNEPRFQKRRKDSRRLSAFSAGWVAESEFELNRRNCLPFPSTGQSEHDSAGPYAKIQQDIASPTPSPWSTSPSAFPVHPAVYRDADPVLACAGLAGLVSSHTRSGVRLEGERY